jgi:hypothetical protein
MKIIKVWKYKLKIYLVVVLCALVAGCEGFFLMTEDNYYMSFEDVDGIVIEAYGKPEWTLINNIIRPLDYRLDRSLYTLYIRHYKRYSTHPQYTLQAITPEGEELSITYLIPSEEWPTGEDGYGKPIYCYDFDDVHDQVDRSDQVNGVPKVGTTVVRWTHQNRSLHCEGGAKYGPLNRIDFALFNADGELVAEERLPVKHIKNGSNQYSDI